MTSKKRIAVTASALALGLAGLGVVGFTSAGSAGITEQEARDHFATWNAALATGDPRAVADLYADDAVLLPTVAGHVHDTRAEREEYFTAFLANRPVGTITESVVRVVDDNTAIHSGLYEFALTAPDGTRSTVPARFTYVLAEEDGRVVIEEHHSSKVPS
jgi:uncharacterized protein (TIGR02246 family)